MGIPGSGISGSGIPTPLLLLALSALHPITGKIHEPLLVLEGQERDGIRLRCLSERPFPDVRLLWSGEDGQNLSGTAEPTDTGNAGSSLLLRPGAGNAAACRLLDPRSRWEAQSSVVIADVFFPATSPWLPAFVLLLILGLCLVLAAAYKLRRMSQALAKERKKQQEVQEEIEDLKMELEEEEGKFKRENQEMTSKIELIQAQIDFRRAQSHAVPLTLDASRTHPSLSIRGRSWIEPAAPGSRPPPGAAAVAREGFSSGKHYWEVEVGEGSSWELGVLAEELRDSLRDPQPSLPEEKAPALGYSQGEFRLPGGKLERNSGPVRVLGVLLDQERRALSFFDAEEKRLLGSVPVRIPGNLFPFFGLGDSGDSLGIRPVGV